MFYLEIFEFNFCHLNKNTKKNVQKRAETEQLIDDTTSSKSTYAEVGSGYVIKDSKSMKSDSEMCYMNKSIKDEESKSESENISSEQNL